VKVSAADPFESVSLCMQNDQVKYILHAYSCYGFGYLATNLCSKVPFCGANHFIVVISLGTIAAMANSNAYVYVAGKGHCCWRTLKENPGLW
jgi:hypothetical protein